MLNNCDCQIHRAARDGSFTVSPQRLRMMNELQNTEREMVDALQTQFRNSETMWQSVAGFRDEQFRTNDRVMTMR